MSIVGNAPSDSVDLADIELPSNVPAGGQQKLFVLIVTQNSMINQKCQNI
jgi:hypothetical protein